MSRFALYLALLCVAAQSARALQLGETREQLAAKHGAPGAEDHAHNLAAYFWEGWSAQLEFQDNAVRKITYRRNWYLQDAEIASLLESNGGASHWREISATNASARQWTRDDGASATCARTRPLSIVFQAAGLAAVYQQGPKVVVPATPSPATPIPSAPAPAMPVPTFTKAPTFPKLLGSVPEPDLPVADPAPAPPEPARAEQAIPKLPAADLGLKPKPTPEKDTAPAAAPPKPELPAVAPAGESHALGYVLGSLALLVTLGGGGIYFFKRQARPGKALTARVAATTSSNDVISSIPGLVSLRSDQVELLIGEIFRREGYTVELSAGLNSDDGIDLMLRRDSETTLVQCKHWQAERVTSRETREFYGAMAAGGAPHGILVTTGTFSPDACEFAEGKGIELIDGEALAAKIATVAKPGENLCAVSTWIDDFVAHARIFDPECPVCHGTMVIRNNRASGAPSWSCRGYPRCPGRREPRLDLLPSTTPH